MLKPKTLLQMHVRVNNEKARTSRQRGTNPNLLRQTKATPTKLQKQSRLPERAYRQKSNT